MNAYKSTTNALMAVFLVAVMLFAAFVPAVSSFSDVSAAEEEETSPAPAETGQMSIQDVLNETDLKELMSTLFAGTAFEQYLGKIDYDVLKEALLGTDATGTSVNDVLNNIDWSAILSSDILADLTDMNEILKDISVADLIGKANIESFAKEYSANLGITADELYKLLDGLTLYDLINNFDLASILDSIDFAELFGVDVSVDDYGNMTVSVPALPLDADPEKDLIYAKDLSVTFPTDSESEKIIHSIGGKLLADYTATEEGGVLSFSNEKYICADITSIIEGEHTSHSVTIGYETITLTHTEKDEVATYSFDISELTVPTVSGDLYIKNFTITNETEDGSVYGNVESFKIGKWEMADAVNTILNKEDSKKTFEFGDIEVGETGYTLKNVLFTIARSNGVLTFDLDAEAVVKTVDEETATVAANICISIVFSTKIDAYATADSITIGNYTLNKVDLTLGTVTIESGTSTTEYQKYALEAESLVVAKTDKSTYNGLFAGVEFYEDYTKCGIGFQDMRTDITEKYYEIYGDGEENGIIAYILEDHSIVNIHIAPGMEYYDEDVKIFSGYAVSTYISDVKNGILITRTTPTYDGENIPKIPLDDNCIKESFRYTSEVDKEGNTTYKLSTTRSELTPGAYVLLTELDMTIKGGVTTIDYKAYGDYGYVKYDNFFTTITIDPESEESTVDVKSSGTIIISLVGMEVTIVTDITGEDDDSFKMTLHYADETTSIDASCELTVGKSVIKGEYKALKAKDGDTEGVLAISFEKTEIEKSETEKTDILTLVVKFGESTLIDVKYDVIGKKFIEYNALENENGYTVMDDGEKKIEVVVDSFSDPPRLTIGIEYYEYRDSGVGGYRPCDEIGHSYIKYDDGWIAEINAKEIECGPVYGENLTLAYDFDCESFNIHVDEIGVYGAGKITDALIGVRAADSAELCDAEEASDNNIGFDVSFRAGNYENSDLNLIAKDIQLNFGSDGMIHGCIISAEGGKTEYATYEESVEYDDDNNRYIEDDSMAKYYLGGNGKLYLDSAMTELATTYNDRPLVMYELSYDSDDECVIVYVKAALEFDTVSETVDGVKVTKVTIGNTEYTVEKDDSGYYLAIDGVKEEIISFLGIDVESTYIDESKVLMFFERNGYSLMAQQVYFGKNADGPYLEGDVDFESILITSDIGVMASSLNMTTTKTGEEGEIETQTTIEYYFTKYEKTSYGEEEVGIEITYNEGTIYGKIDLDMIFQDEGVNESIRLDAEFTASTSTESPYFEVSDLTYNHMLLDEDCEFTHLALGNEDYVGLAVSSFGDDLGVIMCIDGYSHEWTEYRNINTVPVTYLGDGKYTFELWDGTQDIGTCYIKVDEFGAYTYSTSDCTSEVVFTDSYGKDFEIYSLALQDNGDEPCITYYSDIVNRYLFGINNVKIEISYTAATEEESYRFNLYMSAEDGALEIPIIEGGKDSTKLNYVGTTFKNADLIFNTDGMTEFNMKTYMVKLRSYEGASLTLLRINDLTMMSDDGYERINIGGITALFAKVTDYNEDRIFSDEEVSRMISISDIELPAMSLSGIDIDENTDGSTIWAIDRIEVNLGDYDGRIDSFATIEAYGLSYTESEETGSDTTVDHVYLEFKYNNPESSEIKLATNGTFSYNSIDDVTGGPCSFAEILITIGDKDIQISYDSRFEPDTEKQISTLTIASGSDEIEIKSADDGEEIVTDIKAQIQGMYLNVYNLSINEISTITEKSTINSYTLEADQIYLAYGETEEERENHHVYMLGIEYSSVETVIDDVAVTEEEFSFDKFDLLYETSETDLIWASCGYVEIEDLAVDSDITESTADTKCTCGSIKVSYTEGENIYSAEVKDVDIDAIIPVSVTGVPQFEIKKCDLTADLVYSYYNIDTYSESITLTDIVTTKAITASGSSDEGIKGYIFSHKISLAHDEKGEVDVEAILDLSVTATLDFEELIKWDVEFDDFHMLAYGDYISFNDVTIETTYKDGLHQVTISVGEIVGYDNVDPKEGEVVTSIKDVVIKVFYDQNNNGSIGFDVIIGATDAKILTYALSGNGAELSVVFTEGKLDTDISLDKMRFQVDRQLAGVTTRSQIYNVDGEGCISIYYDEEEGMQMSADITLNGADYSRIYKDMVTRLTSIETGEQKFNAKLTFVDEGDDGILIDSAVLDGTGCTLTMKEPNVEGPLSGEYITTTTFDFTYVTESIDDDYILKAARYAIDNGIYTVTLTDSVESVLETSAEKILFEMKDTYSLSFEDITMEMENNGYKVIASGYSGTVGGEPIDTVSVGDTVGTHPEGTFLIGEEVKVYMDGDVVPTFETYEFLVLVQGSFIVNIGQDEFSMPYGTVMEFDRSFIVDSEDGKGALTSGSYKAENGSIITLREVEEGTPIEIDAKNNIDFGKESVSGLPDDQKVVVKTDSGTTISMPASAVKRIIGDNESVTMNVVTSSVEDSEKESIIIGKYSGANKDRLEASTFVDINIPDAANLDDLGEIVITIPFDLNGRDPSKLTAYYFNETTNSLEEIGCRYYEIDGQGYADLTTTHYSGYVIGEQLESPKDNGGISIGIVAGGVVAILAVAGAGAFVFIRTRKAL